MSIDGRSREKKIGPSKVYVWKTLEFYMELDTDIVFFFFSFESNCATLIAFPSTLLPH